MPVQQGGTLDRMLGTILAPERGVLGGSRCPEPQCEMGDRASLVGTGR